VRLQAHKNLHTFTKQARLRARPGEEAPLEKLWPVMCFA
jgi:hypothetical protein